MRRETFEEASPISAPSIKQLPRKLPKNSVFRSLKGRDEFLRYYQKTIESLPHPVRQKTVSTSFGKTHFSMMGNPNGRQIVILPGMSIAGPMMLDFFAYLAKDHYLIAPDLIGQPGLSEDKPFSPNNNAYGRWLAETLDGLKLEKADFAATSFGGSISLELLKLAPERVGKQALIVTAGLTPKLPYLQIYAKLLISWMAYRYMPIKKSLRTIARPLSRHLTDENLKYLDIVLRQTAFWRHRPAGPFFKEDFRSDTEPVLITFAANDILFPFGKTVPHAKETLNIGESFTLNESAHMPSEKEMAPIHKRIEAYFKI
jgi:pimeloyl-ACP methyl ester carboxylesterase